MFPDIIAKVFIYYYFFFKNQMLNYTLNQALLDVLFPHVNTGHQNIPKVISAVTKSPLLMRHEASFQLQLTYADFFAWKQDRRLLRHFWQGPTQTGGRITAGKNCLMFIWACPDSYKTDLENWEMWPLFLCLHGLIAPDVQKEGIWIVCINI